MTSSDCGAAALAMVMGYHGCHVPLDEIRLRCASRDGISALTLVQVAQHHGFVAKGLRLDLDALFHLPLPMILHWRFSHFVVLERVRRGRAEIVDPANGRRWVGREELDHCFTGVAVAVHPAEGVLPRRPKALVLTRYWPLFLDAAKPLMLVLTASVTLQVLGLVAAASMQVMLDAAITGRAELLWGVGAGLGVVVAIRATALWIRSTLLQGLQVHLDRSLQTTFVRRLLRLPYTFFQLRSPGDLLERVQRHAAIRTFFTQASVSVVLDGVMAFTCCLLLVAYSRKLSAVVLVFCVLRVLAAAVRRRARQDSMVAEFAGSAKESGILFEAVSSVESVRAFGLEPHMARRWEEACIERGRATADQRAIGANVDFLAAGLNAAALSVVLFLGGQEVILNRMTLGSLAVFLGLEALLVTPLDNLLRAAEGVERLRGYLLQAEDVMEEPTEPMGGRVPNKLVGAIEFRRVTFSYGPAALPVLSNLNMTIRAGEMVAIVGSSGAGKSTLVRLLVGLLRPTEGSILLDGIDMRDLDLVETRRRIGLVLQDDFLLDDTLRANIALGEPDAPTSRLEWAARMACLDRVVETLPEGYDTRIGENGRRLSGGERQRLCLARALLRQPMIVVLDEATSAVDPATEARIHEHLSKLRCTRLVVAHRLTTVQRADRALAIESGRVVGWEP